MGIDLTGRKDILGLWISENEGAKFWLNNFTEMKNRGLKDILIACSNNLTGMSEAISAVYPETEHQLCIVHQIRSSLAYVRAKWTMPIQNWNEAMAHFLIKFENRI